MGYDVASFPYCCSSDQSDSAFRASASGAGSRRVAPAGVADSWMVALGSET